MTVISRLHHNLVEEDGESERREGKSESEEE